MQKHVVALVLANHRLFRSMVVNNGLFGEKLPKGFLRDQDVLKNITSRIDPRVARA